MGAQGQEWDSPLRGGGGDEAEDREGLGPRGGAVGWRQQGAGPGGAG